MPVITPELGINVLLGLLVTVIIPLVKTKLFKRWGEKGVQYGVITVSALLGLLYVGVEHYPSLYQSGVALLVETGKIAAVAALAYEYILKGNNYFRNPTDLMRIMRETRAR